jgi:5'-deoxy-5'-methylthioadenosine phosphorylase
MFTENVAIIGGTGLGSLQGLQRCDEERVETPYGAPSAALLHGDMFGRQIIFLPRHGPGHDIAPHKVNYRANMWALKQVGVQQIIAIAAVGGIHPAITPGRLCIPDQIIDYTCRRENTFFEGGTSGVTHIDFSQPYCGSLREKIIQAARMARLGAYETGTYGATEGPRLETAAEIDRMDRDGCHIVGMTGMPEAALARELELCYATCAVCANPAAGRAEGRISMEKIIDALAGGMKQVQRLLEQLLPRH